ncbi:MAG: hypothetical protein M1828_000678 [Chrysothrix sp. TS-e1954]|nr:MAG: hypothetical protein M1828_000678 [Chrysothrix sp. TS-e1954]
MPFDEDREKGKVAEYQKWDYITLSDFKSTSCGTTFSYAWLWFLAIIAVAVYAADTYTAVSLLVFNHWSSQIKPTVPFDVSKWIFAICILLSWLLAGYEWFRAFRVMRKNSVANDYLDPLASRLQSMRVGGGQGWRRFLVFAELTKSKKGADYVALFVYFQLKGSFRVLIAEGPRQVINALTLYSVMQANLLPTGAQKDHSSFVQFWINVRIMGQTQGEHAAILFTMLFTLVIWVFSFLSFVVALVLYITFLWHYIPSGDNGLSGYCRRKIEKRLSKIVASKVEKAVEKADAKRRRAEYEAMRTGRPMRPPERKPTLPSMFGDKVDAASMTTTLSRKPTQSTLPPAAGFLSRSGSGDEPPRQPQLPALPTLPNLGYRPNGPVRNGTQSSEHSAVSDMSQDDRPLIQSAATMGSSAPPFANYTIVQKPSPASLQRNGSTPSMVSPMSRPLPPWDPRQRKPLPNPALRRLPRLQNLNSSFSSGTVPPTPVYGSRQPTPGPPPALNVPNRSMTAGPMPSSQPRVSITRNFSLVHRPATAGPMLHKPSTSANPDTKGPAYEMQAPPRRPLPTPVLGSDTNLAYQPESYRPFTRPQHPPARPPRSPPYDGRIIDSYR